MMMDLTQTLQGQHDAVTWFAKYQLQSVINNGVVPEWFHGIISRKTAEDLLMPKPPGYFLIRVSESRIGYTLSYRAEDRCRHFMIDARQDGQYEIVGENRCHQSLQDLVDYHRRTPIMPFSQVLTVACGQPSNDMTNYAELLFPQKHPKPNSSLPPNNLLFPHTSHQAAAEEEEEEIPPALPYRPTNLISSEVLSPNRLYPCLDVEFTQPAIPLPVKPVPIPRKRYAAENPSASQPPEVPSRSSVPLRLNQVCTRTVSAPENTSTSGEQAAAITNTQPGKQLEAKVSVVTNFRNLKKKFQKKRSNSQDTTYAEIPKAETDHAENEYQAIDRERTFSGTALSYPCTDVRQTGQGLPQEYFTPPPFAPGH
ncbi:hematopoietic SH2 domain-containing protein homolog [Salarias fasciatus]|uniref:hematopoietic SH2 domain-containing protein homolog n=1 Tax=Salarias fasciatus TaxID=181472 RepID=UPI001176F3BB|nr:hematopoietic SH2 domain-containing protein homolog [Salarias fasciatus]